MNLSQKQEDKKNKKAQNMPDDVALGTNKLISVHYRTGEPWINIRTYRPDHHGRMLSTKRGILLNLKEWH